eukprot:GSMAST32.ASY1.ANO1.2473.1 assembled CDS
MADNQHFSNSKIFPDLHRKMSKKIAALTKVIYHLNTRNEDNEAELDQVSLQHESEMDQILKDAAKKLNHFKDLLDQRKEQAATKGLMDQLISQHDQEKKAALAEFKDYKKTMRNRQHQLEKDMIRQVNSLKRDVSDAKEKFKKKLSEFSKVSNKLEKSSANARKEMNEMKQKHKNETTVLVQEWNDKLEALENKLKSTHSAELSKQTASCATKDKMEEEMQKHAQKRNEEYQMRQDILHKKVQTLDQLQMLIEKERTSKNEVIDRSNLLQKKIDSGEEHIAKQRSDLKSLQNQIKDLGLNLSKHKLEIEEIHSRFKQSIERESKLKIDIEKSASETKSEREKCNNVLNDMKTLKIEFVNTKDSLEKALKNATDEIAKQQKELESLRASEKDLKQKELQTNRDWKGVLESQKQSAELTMSKASEEFRLEMKSAKEKFGMAEKNAQNKFTEKLEKLKLKAQKTEQDLQNKHKVEIEKLKKELEATTARVKTKGEAHLITIKDVNKKLSEEVEKANLAKIASEEERDSLHIAIDGLKQQVEKLRQQLVTAKREAHEKLEKERQAIVEDWKKRIAANEEMLRNSHDVNIANSLEKQRKDLELKASKLYKIHQEKLELALLSGKEESVKTESLSNETEMRAQHLEALRQVKDKHAQMLAAAHQQGIDSLMRANVTAKESEEKNAERAKRDLTELKSKLVTERIKLLAENMEKALTNSKRKVKQTENEWKEETKRLKQGHSNNTEQMHRQHTEKQDRLIDEHLAETKDLNEQFQKAHKMLLDQQKLLQDRLQAIQEKYENRESRPEDTSRIAELELECSNHSKIVKKMMQEMKFYKLELVNRENNYNKMFKGGGGMGGLNVGVIDPLANKKSSGIQRSRSRNSGLQHVPGISGPGSMSLGQGMASMGIGQFTMNNPPTAATRETAASVSETKRTEATPPVPRKNNRTRGGKNTNRVGRNTNSRER